MLRPGRGADDVKWEDASRSRVSGHTDKNTRWKMGLVISGTVWHVTWQHFRGDLWLLLQLTYTSPFPAPTLHPKLVCQMEWCIGFISGLECAEKKFAVVWDVGKAPPSGFRFYNNAERKTKVISRKIISGNEDVAHKRNVSCFSGTKMQVQGFFFNVKLSLNCKAGNVTSFWEYESMSDNSVQHSLYVRLG